MWFARIAAEAGWKIVGLSDSKGGAYDPEGIDLEGFKTLARPLSQEEFLASECDVLVPAALENQITVDIAKKLRCKAVLEMANGPTTPEADDILEERGITVIPDVLANSGGVTVSCFEWIQNLTREEWTEERVNERLREKMSAAWNAVGVTRKRYGGSMRESAFILAVQRIAEAMDARGN